MEESCHACSLEFPHPIPRVLCTQASALGC